MKSARSASVSTSLAAAASRAVCSIGPCIEPLEDRTLMSTYFVSPNGNDSNSGTSTGSPWKSIGKVNSITLHPGDSVLFQGGQTFDGTLNISSKDSGSSSAPVTIGSYNGKATIYSGGSTGAFVNDVSDVTFNGLNFSASPSSGVQSGIDLEGYTRGKYYTNDVVENSTLTGYYYAGILIEAAYSGSGFSGMLITGNTIDDNVEAGIESCGADSTCLTNMTVSYNQVFNNYGDGHSQCTGSGIDLGDVSYTTVEYNDAYLNGDKGGQGGVGIWAYDANFVTFQYNESYDNVTTRGQDGDGFDFDANVSNSIIQYNYAFNNDGTGAQLDQWQNNGNFKNNIVRYNVFQDNGRLNNYGNLEVWGHVLNCDLYNNVIYTTPGKSGSNSGIRVHNSTIPGLYVDGVHFMDNIIDTTGGASLINIPEGEAQGAQDLEFIGNVYYTNGSSFNIIDGNTTLHSLSAWQAKGEEKWDGKNYGISANPDFVNSNSAQAAPQASQSSLSSAAAGYKLESYSPVYSQMLSVTALYGLATGQVDFFGNGFASNAYTYAGAYEAAI